MPDAQIHPIGDEAAPADYGIPSGAELALKGAYAKFDGSGAGSSFRPVLRIVSDAGTVSLEAPADVIVAAGESATVSWFPHVGGDGIRFDEENAGDWLYVKTTGNFGDFGVMFDGSGVEITNRAGGGGNAALEVVGGDTADNVGVAFGGDSDGSPFYLQGSDFLHALVHSFLTLDVFGTGADVGKDAELNMSLDQVTLAGNQGVDIISNPSISISPFPVSFGVNSVEVAAGDDSNHGTVVLEAFDNQGTPVYTAYLVGYVNFSPNPYSYNGQTAQIRGGQKFTIVGSDGSPIFQVLANEQGGTVHIKTGTTVHADL